MKCVAPSLNIAEKALFLILVISTVEIILEVNDSSCQWPFNLRPQITLYNVKNVSVHFHYDWLLPTLINNYDRLVPACIIDYDWLVPPLIINYDRLVPAWIIKYDWLVPAWIIYFNTKVWRQVTLGIIIGVRGIALPWSERESVF